MKKLLTFIFLFSLALAHAGDEYLGLYKGGDKIGYASYRTQPATLGKKNVTRTDTKTIMRFMLLGSPVDMNMTSSTWTSNEGKPLVMRFVQSSAGRSETVVATFGTRTVEIDIASGGRNVHKSLPIPAGGAIVDDPLEVLVGKNAPIGAKQTVFVLDPTTATFMKNQVVLVGPKETTVRERPLKATLIQIIDPRMTMDVYVGSKGELLKVEGPMGIEMLPESKEVALSMAGTGYKPSSDLAFTTSIRPDKQISDPETLTGLTIQVTGRDLSQLPSDEHQTVRKNDVGWVVDVHPPKLRKDRLATIAASGLAKPQWLQPTLHIPCDSKTFRDLSKRIIKGETKVVPAALAIKEFVTNTMRPNAGIGVLRDASEVLSSKEGVCRDYAILTVTLMRAAGIPARLASGVVNWQGDFYYHAWAEVWDGDNWIGIDSTVPQKQISAAHVKLADGNVEEAFAFTFLDKVKIEVLDLRRK